MNQYQSSDMAETYAEFCKGLGNTSRLLIVYALANHGMTVGTLAKTVGLSQSNTSHNLKTLLDHGIVRAKRDGQTICYTLADLRLIQALDMLWGTMSGHFSQEALHTLKKQTDR